MFSDTDKEQINAHGLTLEQVEAQLERFRKGFAAIELDRPCTVGDGILQVPEAEQASLIGLHEKAAAAGRMMKFVPASGAASRMFRDLIRFYQQDREQAELSPDLTRFFTLLDRFPFYDTLKETMRTHGQDIDASLAAQDYSQILKFLLTSEGLHYAHTPKALIPFHRYPQETRTALAEHMFEAAQYIRDAQQICRIHLSITSHFREAIESEIAKVSSKLQLQGIHFDVACSIQDTGTDTIAVNLENQVYRDDRGHLVFRPGGHGALLQNLNAVSGDIIFIKNIDNVIRSSRLDEMVRYKKILGGLLVQTQEQIFALMRKLSSTAMTTETVQEAKSFLSHALGITMPPLESPSEQVEWLRDQLNRPLRICGVVPNVGEPGGGPFWIREADQKVSKQLVESTQVRRTDPEQETILQGASHFNPVDMVCGVRDYQGRAFDLMRYRDPEKGLITGKTDRGQELKALEWPGLWNGGMARWLTLLVDIPLSTFAPVKSTNDLLRPQHQ